MQTLTTVHHHPVKTEAPASMESTPSSVSAQTAGRAACVMSVSMCVRLKGPALMHGAGYTYSGAEPSALQPVSH